MWIKQPDEVSCGPTAIYNLQDTIKLKAYTFEEIRDLCHCDDVGTRNIWFARALCDVCGTYGWRVIAFPPNSSVEKLYNEVTNKNIQCILWIKNHKKWPRGHYTLVDTYCKGIFSCINWSGDIENPNFVVGVTSDVMEQIFGEARITKIWSVRKVVN